MRSPLIVTAARARRSMLEHRRIDTGIPNIWQASGIRQPPGRQIVERYGSRIQKKTIEFSNGYEVDSLRHSRESKPEIFGGIEPCIVAPSKIHARLPEAAA